MSCFKSEEMTNAINILKYVNLCFHVIKIKTKKHWVLFR